MSRGDRLDSGARGRAPVRRGARVRRSADVAEDAPRCGAGSQHATESAVETAPERAGTPELVAAGRADALATAYPTTLATLAATQRQLSILDELGLNVPSNAELAELLAAGRCKARSIKRYLGAVRSWMRYCIDRREEPHDASTATLLNWLDWRCRNSESPQSAIRMSLAAARFVQRGRCVVLGVDALPYTPKARIQLDAFKGAATLNASPSTMAKPLRLDELAELVAHVRGDVRPRRGVDVDKAEWLALRDAAMLLVGWWAAFRADDLARLEWSHCHWVMRGIELHIPFSKTTSALLALARRNDRPDLCPVRALATWKGYSQAPTIDGVTRRDDQAGVFGLETGGHVGRRIRALFARHNVPEGYSGHSLRAGFATEAASQGVPDRLVQLHGRWRSVQVHAAYVRSGRLWQDTPTERIACPTTTTADTQTSYDSQPPTCDAVGVVSTAETSSEQSSNPC